MADKGNEINIKVPSLGISKHKIWMLVSAVLALILVLMWIGILPTKITGSFVASEGGTTLSATEAGQKSIDYINDYLVSTGEATLVDVEDMSGIYRVTTSYQDQDIYVYVTKDGRFLFVSGDPIDISITPTTTTTTTQPTMTCEDVTKVTSPEMEAFVVSYCPYGLQMQRILTEVVENIPTLEDSIKIRYMGAVTDGEVTSMHGEEEATENLRQICIREQQPNKYWDYISCFIKEGEVSNCLIEAGVDEDMLDVCMVDGTGVDYAEEDFALQAQYSVTGSPTLILNGEKVSEFDFGGRTAEAVKTLLCCGFSTQPTGCSEELTAQQAATSFSPTYSSSSGSGSGTC
jgi:protein-disulfide isomerase